MSFTDHRRLHTSLLAASEKRLLIWIARRLPAWVNSDHLTGLGFAGMVAAALSYWASGSQPAMLFLAISFLAVNWFGDSLDGTLARVRDRGRPRYGFYIDHILDVIGAACLVGGLGFSGYMSPAVAAVLLVVYLIFNAEMFLATYTLGIFKMSYWKFGPTELRILLAIGTLRLFFHPEVSLAGRRLLLFDVGGVIAAGVLLVTLIASVVRNARALSAAEPLS